jgi:hypothetical protein
MDLFIQHSFESQLFQENHGVKYDGNFLLNAPIAPVAVFADAI